MRIFLFIALATLISCNKTKNGKTKAGPPKLEKRTPAKKVVAKSPMDELMAWSASDVAIVGTEKGLMAVSADGAKKKTLVPGYIGVALVDHKAQGVWFVKGEKKPGLYFYDLTKAAEPMAVAVPFPTLDGDPVNVEVVYGKKQRLGTSSSHNFSVALKIMMGDKVTAKLVTGMQAEAGGESAKELLAKVTPHTFKAGPALDALVKRGAGRTLEAAWKSPASTPKKLKLDDVEECTQDKEMQSICGEIQPLPFTSYYIVTTRHSCGDMCHQTRLLYDPAKKLYISMKDYKTTNTDPYEFDSKHGFSGATVSKAGKAMITGGAITHLTKGDVFKGVNEGGGWLKGQKTLW